MFTLALVVAVAAPVADPQQLWDAWPKARFVETVAPCLRHAELLERLGALESKHRGRLSLEEVGRSVEGRAIHLLTLGRGPRTLLLWSQMHGDEPSATPALLDVADYLLGREGDPAAQHVLDTFTLLMLPMLNPDGGERYERRNAQAIDINRDALSLATPEGRLLKAVRDRHRPELGFNLHDQDRRTTVGDTGVLASVALLAVAGDAAGTSTPGRERARRVCSAVAQALAPFVPGGIARYDEDWSPRAFGDNLTAWGTPVVLIESGGLATGREPAERTRLNFVALITALQGLAEDDLAGSDPALYEALRRNSDGAYSDVVVRGARILQAPAREPYRADLAFDLDRDERADSGCGTPRGGSRIVEIGDARFIAAGRSVDVGAGLIVPAFAASVRGRDVRRWLDASTLDKLARLGVGRLRWHVEPRERETAVDVVAALSAPGRPSIELVGPRDDLSALVIAGPPRQPASRAVRDIRAALAPLAPLAGAAAATPEPTRSALPPPPALAPRAPASFLVLTLQGPDADPDHATLDAVWLDGVEVR